MTIRAVVSVLVGFFILGGGGYAGYQFLNQPKPQTYIVCEEDVKQCANGLSVSRVSPACEFPLCPEERPKGSGGVTILPRTVIEGVFPGTLDDLRQNGGDYSCALTVEEGGRKTTGVLYLSQGDARANLSTVIGGEAPNNTHLIVTKQHAVIWKEGKTSGTRSTPEEFAKEGNSGLPVNMNAPYQYDCSAWTRDSAFFGIPEDVTFEDGAAPVAE